MRGYDDMSLVKCGVVDSCGRPPSGSSRSDRRLERLAAFDVQVDPLFRLPITWRPPLSPLNHFLRRRGPVFLVCKTRVPTSTVWSEPGPLSLIGQPARS